MHWSEIERREAAESILITTVARAWRARFGSDFGVRLGPGPHTLYLHRLASAIVTAHPARAARRYLRESFAFTPVLWRLPLQWTAAWVTTSTPALRAALRPILSTSEPVPGVSETVVLPGNRRVRFLDFAEGVSRVVLKEGFPADAVANEIRIRSSSGPFPRLVAHDASAGWFEEELVDGVALARVPAFRSAGHDERAIAELARWHARTSRHVSGRDHARALGERVNVALDAVQQRFGVEVPRTAVSRLLAAVESEREIEIAETHGDFQPGNVMLGRRGDVWIVDWEHARERVRAYDEIVYRFGLRRGGDVAGRMVELARGRSRAMRARRATVAAAVLEDVVFFAEESLGGPFSRPAPGMLRWCESLRDPSALVAAVAE